MSNHMEIANTIRKQIMAGDFWTLAACGARDYIAYPAGQKWVGLGGFDSDLGGLRFRVTITSPRTRHEVFVTLAGDDTYRVALCKITRGKAELKVIEEHDDIYCDQLAECVYSCCNK